MKFLILGAGPSGLTFANALLRHGEEDFLVIEKTDEAGGLCKSVIVDGAPLDIGGGHFLDTKQNIVLDFLFSFMPQSEWNTFHRNSQIFCHNQFIGSPFESYIWQFPIEKQIDYLLSISKAKCNIDNSNDVPEKFVDWIYWKLGDKIANDYMLPYNKKMFGENLNSLGTYWLNKLPSVSFYDTLRSCLERKFFGNQPAHSVFLYPKKYGYGELWIRMAERLKGKIKFNYNVSEFDIENRIINNDIKADNIIVTIPWTDFLIKTKESILLEKLEAELKHTSVVVHYENKDFNSSAHWIYYPDNNIDYHRILLRENFCSNSKGYWTETNLNRLKRDLTNDFFINEYAYPLNTINKPAIMNSFLSYCKKHNVIGLGRWGEWEHYNSDVVVARALHLVQTLIS